nr:cobalamin biosynthesis protein CobG [Roseobacter litoralis]
MMSGDGLIMRIRPFFARLEAAQVLGLCALAQVHGNGFLDLTNRANIQIRGVQPNGLDDLLAGLGDLDLLDHTPTLETRRNIILTPFWRAGDDSHFLYNALTGSLCDLPELPAKFGFVIDAGEVPVLGGASGDIRIERGADGLILRADGAAYGHPMTRGTAVAAIHHMAQEFARQRRPEQRRMAAFVSGDDAPGAEVQAAPPVVPGPHPLGVMLGAAFGQLDAAAVSRLMQETGARALRVTPWRLFLLEGVSVPETRDFITCADDPLLHVDACPGAPHCASATVSTRDLARRLAACCTGSLHVSGCAKGCARKSCADITFVGNQGRFDLVRNGHAWDAPEKSGLLPDSLMAELTGRK